MIFIFIAQIHYLLYYRSIFFKENKLKCRILNPHELRHTYGSLIYEATGDIYITSKLMRHSDIKITAKTYVHETMATKHAALAQVLEFRLKV